MRTDCWVLLCLSIFDATMTTIWQKFSPGDWNPLVEWLMLRSPVVALVAIVAGVVAALMWASRRSWTEPFVCACIAFQILNAIRSLDLIASLFR